MRHVLAHGAADAEREQPQPGACGEDRHVRGHAELACVGAHPGERDRAEERAGRRGEAVEEHEEPHHAGALLLADGLERQEEEAQLIGAEHCARECLQAQEVPERAAHHPQRTERHHAERAPDEEPPRAVRVRNASPHRRGQALGREAGRDHRQHGRIAEAELPAHVRREEGLRHLHGHGHGHHRAQEPPVRALPDARRELEHAHAPMAAQVQALGLALVLQVPEAREAAQPGDGEDRGEGGHQPQVHAHVEPQHPLRAAGVAEHQHHAAHEERAHDRHLVDPRPPTEVPHADAAREERSHPRVPRGRRAQVHRPVDARDRKQHPRGHRAHERGNHHRHEAEHLDGGAEHDPASW